MIDKIMTKRMKRDERKKKDAAKKAGMPTKTQLHKAVLARKRSKYSKDCMLRETKQKKSREYQKELRKKLNDDPVKKEEFKRKRSEYMARIRAYEKWATNHNMRYESMSDKVPTKMSQKETTLSFGKVSRNYLFVFPRMKTLGQDIYYEREPLGKMGDGVFQEITPASMQNVTCMAWTLLGGDWRASFANSLDNGSGMGNPSTYFSQCYFEFGFHVGVEFDKGMTNSAVGNLKRLTEKGFANYKAGYFDPEYIAQHGELCHVRPPNVALLHGDIEQYKHLAGFDFIYGFDKVNSWTTKEAVRLAWDHPMSKNCKLMITNSDMNEVRDLGYTDLVQVGKIKIQFARMGRGSESRTSYFYMRKSFHSLPKNKWTFEFESPELEVGHPFNDVWEIFNQGRLDPVTKKLREDCAINWKIIEMNLKQDTDVNFVERVDRSTRNMKVNYNEKALANRAFGRIPTFAVVTPSLSTSAEEDRDNSTA